LTTLVLLGLMLIMVVGLFVSNYKSPTFVLEEEATLNTDENTGNYLKNRYPSLSPDELKVLSGTSTNQDLLNGLITQFNSDKDAIGIGLCLFIIAKDQSSDSLYNEAGKSLLGNPEEIITQEDADFVFEKAKKAYINALEINKDNLSANNGLALCYIDYYQNVMKGVGLLKETLSQDTNNIEAIQYLGFLSIKSNQLEKASERFKKLVDLQPLNPEHYNNLSQVYLRMGDKQKANLYLEMGKNLSENK